MASSRRRCPGACLDPSAGSAVLVLGDFDLRILADPAGGDGVLEGAVERVVTAAANPAVANRDLLAAPRPALWEADFHWNVVAAGHVHDRPFDEARAGGDVLRCGANLQAAG